MVWSGWQESWQSEESPNGGAVPSIFAHIATKSENHVSYIFQVIFKFVTVDYIITKDTGFSILKYGYFKIK